MKQAKQSVGFAGIVESYQTRGASFTPVAHVARDYCAIIDCLISTESGEGLEQALTLLDASEADLEIASMLVWSEGGL